MSKIRVGIAALSLVLAIGCLPVNPTSLSYLAYLGLLQSGLYVQEGEVFRTNYYEGYNLNFEITEAQASSLLPPNLTPLALKIVETDPEERYYLSWYMAVMDTNDQEPVTRIDLFTYATDPEGDLALHFVSSYISLPESLLKLGLFDVFVEIFDFFAKDSETGEPAYPHYFTDTLTADHDTFNLVYGDSSIQISACAPLSTNGRFTRDFIMANSQIYRSVADKNINYFNQSFIDADVETRDLDCVTSENISGFHPMLTENNLRSVQFYGSPDKKITWYYESAINGVVGNPFDF